jgi:nucleotide-binding universal stress UspA family protein
MERILVSMSVRNGAWEAWSRAISLAKRIDARIYALLVLCPSSSVGGGLQEKEPSSIKRRLELLIELAKSEGVRIDYFISEGEYEEEVIQFVDHNKITLLVAEVTEGENRHTDRGFTPIRKILHRIKCRVELVSPRKNQQHNV